MRRRPSGRMEGNVFSHNTGKEIKLFGDHHNLGFLKNRGENLKNGGQRQCSEEAEYAPSSDHFACSISFLCVCVRIRERNGESQYLREVGRRELCVQMA